MVRCCTSHIVVSALYEGLRLCHHCRHAPHKLRIAIDASRLKKALDIHHQLVDGRIARGEPGQGFSELERSLEIRWALPPGLRINEVWYCCRPPWRLDECKGFGEECWREPRKRIALG